MKLEKLINKLISLVIVCVLMFLHALFPIQAIAASLSNWRQEVRSYAAGYGFMVNGKYEQKWLFFDSITPQTYEDIYCIRSGDRQNKEYVEEDLYNISSEDKSKLFDSEENYLHFMWILENMYLYGDKNPNKMSEFMELIGVSRLPYNESDLVENNLILQDGAKITGEKYSVSRNEQIIKVTQNEALLQLVHQNHERNTDLVSGVLDNNANRLTGDAATFVERIIDTLYNNKTKFAGYTTNNKNKNFGKVSYDGKVTINAKDTVNDSGADWANGVSGKFAVKNKYKSNITRVKVYINNSLLSSGYQLLDVNGNDITSTINSVLTSSADSNDYEFRVKYNGAVNSTDKIKVELEIDYGSITKASLIKPKQDKALIDGMERNNQFMISVSRSQESDVVSTEQEEEKVKRFDLALTKRVVNVSYPETSLIKQDASYERLKDIDLYKLKNQKDTTARYTMDKSLVDVEEDCIVTYKITVYNEGDIDGYAEEITDYLPDGLELASTENNSTYRWTNFGNGVIKSTYLSKDVDNARKINAFDGETLSSQEILLDCIVKPTASMKTQINNGEKLELDNRAEISKYGYYNETNVFILANELHIDVDSVQNSVFTDSTASDRAGLIGLIKTEFENAQRSGKFLVEKQIDKAILDYQDDDDIERLCVFKDTRRFDLALRKWITAVNGEVLKNSEDKPLREPSQRAKFDEESEQVLMTMMLREGTLDYDNPKEALYVHNGDLVTYRIAIFNEGERDGYAEEVTDYLPAGLEYVENNETNRANGWIATKREDGITVVKTNKLAKANAANIPAGTLEGISENDTQNLIVNYLRFLLLKDVDNNDSLKAYKTLDIVCKVADDAQNIYLTNRAEITKYGYSEYDSNNREVFNEANEVGVDKDSEQNTIKDSLALNSWYFDHYDVVNPQDTFAGVQDDDDFETVYVTYVTRDTKFDLALRKFISAVNGEQLLGSKSREPEVDVTELAAGRATTAEFNNQSKKPLLVHPKDTVEYTIRIFNEGEKDGYARLIMDDVPEEVEMIEPTYNENNEPTNTNAIYRWNMYKLATGNETLDELQGAIEYDYKKYVLTKNAKEAQVIVSDYLSKDVNDSNLIKAFDKDTQELDFKDLKVEFKVKANAIEDNIIINYAQITDDTDSEGNPVEDRDSTPNKWEESPRNDDQDIEKITVAYFDLALYKWVTSAIVIEDGKTTIYDSGHTQEDKTNVLNVSLKKDKLNKVSVKFKYKILVENQGKQGMIEGYAKEIKDHIPEGLKFVEEDNKEFGWKQIDDNTIVTDYLKDTLLKPGETAAIEVVLTWINDANNLGKKINFAEISKDFNDYDDADDVDSTPDNFVDEVKEDDEDKDEVILTIRTGSTNTDNIFLILGVISILAGGCIGIKEFVIKI